MAQQKLLNDDEVKRQSLAAFNQWKYDWIANCKFNTTLIQNPLSSLTNIGQNKVLLICAYGPSLRKHFDLIKEYRKHIDIICVDKAFKALTRHGIKPNFVTLCDANVPYSYMEGCDTKDIILISNICGNKVWTEKWEGPKYFFVNKDNIQSEELFMEISGYHEQIPAASNVSNTCLVLAYYLLRYKLNLLTGYDYSWPIGEYYGDEPSLKECYMADSNYSDIKGDLVRSSNNLMFSNKWAISFINTLGITNFINCSGQGLFFIHQQSELEKELKRISGDFQGG